LPVFHGRHLTAQHGKKGVCVGYYVEIGVGSDHKEYFYLVVGLSLPIDDNKW